ncbi:protein TonB [Sporomusaceae bacterium BoRhaA]|uniref:energy transducer TonB n=1 Tax=Pelorhabdus rhamnosifermentans TaxID=2772457 RepID=UPI001C0632F6|nr:energy transducer TonB [Pelorhabdus rhamnosifermentans]MBU2703480.1 protein TonB [Pelorhabdus rhamnosifermentans]
MAKSKRWRKAMIASLVIHALILTGVGWVASRSLALHEVTEQYVELDLSQEAEDLPLADSVDSSTSGGGSASAAMPRAISTAVAPSVSAVPNVVAATNNLSVLSAEVPKAVGESGRGNAEQSSGGSGHGQGGGGSGHGQGGGGVGRGSGGYTHPEILSQVTPKYPESARRQGIEGTVVLKIQILSNGRPGFVSAYHSSGSDMLDDAAVEAVQQWRFIPAEDKSTGKAIICVTTMPVVFRLN